MQLVRADHRASSQPNTSFRAAIRFMLRHHVPTESILVYLYFCAVALRVYLSTRYIICHTSTPGIFSQQLALDYRCVMMSLPSRSLPPAFAGIVSGPRPLLSRSSDASSATTAAITLSSHHPSSCSPASLSPSSSPRRFKSSSTRLSSPKSKFASEEPVAQQVFASAEGRMPYFCIRGLGLEFLELLRFLLHCITIARS
jgi:hypothetical protein